MAKKGWYYTMWRPSIAWSYLVICIFDFLIAPIANAVFQSMFYPSAVFVPWNSITLSGAGLYHFSMLTIVGATAYGRTQEKLQAMRNAFNGIKTDEVEPMKEPEVK